MNHQHSGRRLLCLILIAGCLNGCNPPADGPDQPPGSQSAPLGALTQISIDGNDDDWGAYAVVGTDAAGDQPAGSTDLAEVQAFNNDRYFYLLIRLHETGITDHYDLLVDVTDGGFDYQFSFWPDTGEAYFAEMPITAGMDPYDGILSAQQGRIIEAKFPLSAFGDRPVRNFLVQTFVEDQTGDWIGTLSAVSVEQAEPVPVAQAEPTALPAQATNTAAPLSVPQPITALNIAQLQNTGFTDLGFEYPLVYQRASNAFSPFRDPGRSLALQSQNNWGAARWTPDGERLIVETSRGIDLLDSHDLTLIAEYDGLIPIDLLTGGEIAAVSGSQVVFLDLLSGATGTKIEVDDPQASMAVSPDGSLLAVATGVHTFDLIGLGDGGRRSIEILRDTMPTGITDLAFSPDGLLLFVTTPVTYGADVITIFQVQSGTKMYEIRAGFPVTHAPGSTTYAYWDRGEGIGSGYVARPSSAGEAQVVSATFPAAIRARDDTGTMTYDPYALSFESGTDALGVLYVGSASVYGPPNALLYVWDLATAQTRTTVNLGYPFAFQFAFSPDGSRFFTVDFDGGIHLWDSASGEQTVSSDRYTFFWPASLNPDGSRLLLPYYDHFDIVEAGSGEVLDSLWYPPYRDYSYSPSVPYESRLTYLSDDLISFWVGYVAGSPSVAQPMRHTYTYDALENEILHRFDYGRAWDSYYACEFSEDGSRQVCRLTDFEAVKHIDVAEVRTGASLLRMRADNIDHYALSRDGLTLAYCDAGAQVISLVDVGVPGIRQIDYPCQAMLFLPGEARLLLADGQVVDLQTRTSVGQFAFDAPYAEFPFVFIRAERGYLFIGSKVFDLETGARLADLPLPAAIHDLAITADELSLILLTDRGLETWQVLQP